MTAKSKLTCLFLTIILIQKSIFAGFVIESERKIPVAYDVDVVVVGGSTGAIAAAVEASKKGAKVFLLAPYTYLGEDICSTGRYWLEPDEKLDTPLAKKIFSGIDKKALPTPMHVKSILDKELLDNNIPFLLGCYPSDLLIDADGNPAGILMTNRAGRQAVKAKVIIDATPRALIARLAGTEFTPFIPGKHIFKRTVIAPAPESGSKLKHRVFSPSNWKGCVYRKKRRSKRLDHKKSNPVFLTEYTLEIDMPDNSISSFEEAEEKARNMTWRKGRYSASERLFMVPSQHIKCEDPFKAKENLFVLGGSAGVSRNKAERLLQTTVYIKLGIHLGKLAGEESLKRRISEPVTVMKSNDKGTQKGEVRELLSGVRRNGTEIKDFLTSPNRSVPVIGEYDVVVVGGGTGGAPAAIASARHGSKTLVVEYLHGLGGVGTYGMIDRYWYGNITGFTKEIDRAVGGHDWDIEEKAEWFRKEIIKAGGDVWFCSMGSGALLEENKIKGVVVTTPNGRGIVLCDTVIDSTGNADIAMAAGAECRFIGEEMFALQGSGLSYRSPGRLYNNSDWTYVNDSDVIDRTRAHVVGRSKYKDKFDISSLITSRERHRIVGDYTLKVVDVLNRKKFHDTVVVSASNFDSHGYTIDPVFRFDFPRRNKRFSSEVPYRCLLPKGLDGILVTGLGISVHRDALPIVRMQPDIQNQGYAAGRAAAMASKNGVSPRDIDIKKLQGHLLEIGILDEQDLQDKDSAPVTEEQFIKALETPGAFGSFAIFYSVPHEISLPLLRNAFTNSEDHEKKIVFAYLLTQMGDVTGREFLQDIVRNSQWDKGWTFVGMGNHGSGYSKVDSMIIALGQHGNNPAVPVIAEKLRQLTLKSEFSHFRSCAIALERIGDPDGATVLAEALKKDGMNGHAFTSIKRSVKATPPDSSDNSTRHASLRELLLARALFLCGDKDGLGEKILKQYADDVRGTYSLYAISTLKGE